ncbi:MAG: NAD(P)-binding protein [candidate division Zixibacteria bacterium]|nr:NAD(P)-binding protein [candidate division Zixibacteria bacterium]
MVKQSAIKIGILGGGITGLIAAKSVCDAKLSPTPEISVYEKNSVPGGLMRSTIANNCCWDNGMFKFTRSDYLVRLFPELFEDIEDCRQKVWRGGKLSDFPFRLNYYLKTESKISLIPTILDYGYSNCCRLMGLGEANLYKWPRYRLTKRMLSRAGLEQYMFKLQGYPPSLLSARLGEDRLGHISINTKPGRLIKLLLAKKQNNTKKPKLVVAKPEFLGIGAIAGKLADLCSAKGVKIFYDSPVTKISHSRGSNYEIQIRHGDKLTNYPADYIISTMPLNKLIEAGQSMFSDECIAIAKELSFMDMYLALFIINKPKLSHRHLIIYSFDKNHKWKRLVARSLPDGTTSIVVEYTFPKNTTVPRGEYMKSVTFDLVEELKLFNYNDIILNRTATVPNAYPIYKLGFENNVSQLQDYIHEQRLISAGRQGQFRYIGSPDAVNHGIVAANKIIHFIKHGYLKYPRPRQSLSGIKQPHPKTAITARVQYDKILENK